MKIYLMILATIITFALWLIAGSLLSMVGLQREELRTQLDNQSSSTLVVPNNEYHSDGPSIQIIPVPDTSPTPDDHYYDNNAAPDPSTNPDRS